MFIVARNESSSAHVESLVRGIDLHLLRIDSRQRSIVDRDSKIAARATWKGHLRLSLVSCTVGMHGAVSSESSLKCHTINRKTGNRIRGEVVDSVTGEPVEREDRVKGCEASKDEYVPIEEDELKEIRLRTY